MHKRGFLWSFGDIAWARHDHDLYDSRASGRESEFQSSFIPLPSQVALQTNLQFYALHSWPIIPLDSLKP
jgi:hypothetical protein